MMTRLTASQRAMVIMYHASALADGRLISRYELAESLFPSASNPPVAPSNPPVDQAIPPADPPAVRPPDDTVSWEDAARILGVSVATCRRYARPSAGRLVRLGDGVTLASVEALTGRRAA